MGCPYLSPPPWSATGIRAALVTAPVVLGLLGAAVAPAVAVAPASLACRGEGVVPDALVRHRTGIVIDAPLRTIWKLQTDVERWPSWQAPVESVERLGRGPLRRGSAFRWTMPIPPIPSIPATSLDVTSTVRQIKHHACIRWTGPAIGEGLRIDGVHVWNFTPVKGGVRVSTEETHTGPQVDADVPTANMLLREGLEAWLRDLKAAAEAPARNQAH
ncbi:SRPBCC family protein [Streptomyces gardneri]|uniref:SRPBCC family protein n=1 Tax=Streptomyces gardneri TaxID=66892 RepID=UPI0036C71558